MSDKEVVASPPYGTGDASFQAAGGVAGLEKLVNDFYDIMDSAADMQALRAMHAADLTESRDKLSRFLSAWLGGPRRYAEKYGTIHVPGAHQHMPIDVQEMEDWLRCMALAIEKQPYTSDFAEYLLRQLRIPAERIRQACAVRRQHPLGAD